MKKTITKKQKNEVKVTIEEFKSSLKGIAAKNLKKLNSMEDKLDITTKKLDSKLLVFSKIQKVVDKRLKEYASKMDSLEDTFFTLYHNIKKNQWQFANEPEDWWNDYLDLKKYYNEMLEE